jgi:hypothetical protein
MRYLLPIPPIGVASYVFVYNIFSKYGGTWPEPLCNLIKEIVWASAISSLFKFRKPGPLGLRLVDPTARRARSEMIGFAIGQVCSWFQVSVKIVS